MAKEARSPDPNAAQASAAVPALYEKDGERFAPTRLARGPWHRDSQHGGPMQGLLARAIEGHPARQPVQIVRFTCDLWRAAPFEPLTTRVRVVREGRSAQWLEAELCAGDRVTARASALRLRASDVPVPSCPAPGPLGRVEDAEAPIRWLGETDPPSDFVNALELRPVEGFTRPAAWLCLRVPLVAGEEPTPFQRAAIACDMVYALPVVHDVQRGSARLLEQPFVAINADTSIQLHRAPSGEWIGLDAEVQYGPNGAGLGRASLCDSIGPLGYAQQSLLLRETQGRLGE